MTLDIDEILTHARSALASDVHIKTGGRLLFRVHGELVPQDQFPAISGTDAYALAKQITSERELQGLSEVGSLDSSYGNQFNRYRVNVCAISGDKEGQNIKMVIRVLPMQIPRPDELGLDTVLSDRSLVDSIITLERGLVLVTGVTGSGKSSTIASLIDRIVDREPVHIITLEQPPEYQFQDRIGTISQRAVPYNTKTFAYGIRDAMRQDPDVIFVGEIRDQETSTAALQAAETGHLVFSTVHSKNTGETVSRLVGFYPQNEHDQIRYNIASNLEFVLAQQLLPTRAKDGRVLAMEVFKTGNAARTYIRKGDEQTKLISYIQTNMKHGCISMDESILRLYQQGRISGEVAIEKAHDIQYMRERIIQTSPLIDIQ
ncbi:Flp pilus assembly complex ATPase component TadA [Candidatus Woesearchaeota archaeon]|nr:Flp pilus assembly complex ATPase component TadA [Candidatus Woesearchaeota archaeon]